MSDENEVPGLLGPPCGYIDLIDAAVYERLDAEDAGPRKYFPLRPSSAGHCTRKLAFELDEYMNGTKYEKEQRSADLDRLFALGHSVEYSVLRYLKDVKLWQVRYQQQTVSFFPLDDGKLIEGSIDFVLISDRWKSIGDVKSKGDKFSSWTESKWSEDTWKYKKMRSVQTINDRVFWIPDLEAFLEEVNDPFLADNFYQLNAYACTEFIKERGIDNAFLLQYNKNKSQLRELRFKPSQAVYERVRTKFLTAHRAIAQAKDPMAAPRDYSLGSMRCGFCDFKKQCWGDAVDARKEYFATWPKKHWPRDTDRLEDVERLEGLYQEWLAAQGRETSADVIEEKLCHALHEAGVNKVRFSDKAVYELKLLKSPRPHFELRKAKP